MRIGAPGSAELVELPIPQVRDGEVLVRVTTASICPTDRRLLARGADPSRVPGHEIGGRLDNGRPVGVHPDVGCGRCEHCLGGFENRCERRVSIGLQRDGGLAEWVAAPEGHVVPVQGVDAELVPLLEPLACSLHAVGRMGVTRGERAVVLGAGAMGILGTWALQAAGARVAVVEPVAERRGQAVDLGADVAIGTDEDVGAALGGDPGVGIVTAPGAEPLAWTLERVGVGGRVHAFAGMPGGALVDANLVHYRHLTLVGSTGSTVEDYRRARDLVLAEDVPLGRLPRDTISLEAAPEALGSDRPPSGLKVVVRIEREVA
ncbi:MAG: zinc-dependent alcohol dehydrogenase [Acidimicrobiales bacterium]